MGLQTHMPVENQRFLLEGSSDTLTPHACESSNIVHDYVKKSDIF